MLPTIDPSIQYLPLAKLKDVAAAFTEGKLAPGPIVVLDTNFRPAFVLVDFASFIAAQKELDEARASIEQLTRTAP